MSQTSKKNLAVQLGIQMLVVIIIISVGFYFALSFQKEEMQHRIADKAQLYSTILGSNLDKILGDNIKSYSALQDRTEELAAGAKDISLLRVIGSDGTIIASSVKEDVWRTVDKTYRPYVEVVSRIKQERSIVQNLMGSDVVIHFLPIVTEVGGKVKLAGVAQINLIYGMRQDQAISTLRKHQVMYLKDEAVALVNHLASELEVILNEATRNFGYLDELIEKMVADEEVNDITFYVKDLAVLASGTSEKGNRFKTLSEDPLHAQAIKDQSVVFGDINKKNQHLEVISPVIIVENQQKTTGGTVSITFTLVHMQKVWRQTLMIVLLMSLIIALSCCLVIGLFFNRRIFSPIKELVFLTGHINKDDLTKRSANKSVDEIGQLAKSFNDMLDQLEQSKQEIEEWNTKLQDRVDEVTDELEEKQEQLLKSEKMASLGVLSSGIAHEINNPLGIILGHTQMLLREHQKQGKFKKPKEAEELLSTIEENTKRCSHIVKSLLQFTRTREVQLVPTDLSSTIENALMFTQSRLESKNIEVIKNFGGKLSIMADPIQLEQVFINILSNAEQSMDKAGSLEITSIVEKGLNHEEDVVRVTFKDSGRGIDEEDLNKIFDPFFTTKEPGEGVGMGLSISYGIIKAHHGDVNVESQKGKGTTITVQLPLQG